MYFLYILECADQTLYTGITVDLDRRIAEHNYSKIGAKYTKARRPVKLVYSKKFANRSLASKAENKMKLLSRKQKTALIHQAKSMAKQKGLLVYSPNNFINSSYSIRQLKNKDTRYLKDLLKVFGTAFNEIDTYQNHIPQDKYLLSLLSKSHFIALVAMVGKQVVGGLAAYELEKFEQERSEIYIYDLAVDKQHRGQGIATQLINQLKVIGSKRGAYVIFVQADKGDDAAIQLSNSLAIQEEVFHFHIAVES